VLHTCHAYPCPQQAQIVKTDLAAIGLNVQVNAPLIACGNLATHDFFSGQTGCQTFGTYGMDLAALRIRHTG
jgi:hypothetical protein